MLVKEVSIGLVQLLNESLFLVRLLMPQEISYLVSKLLRKDLVYIDRVEKPLCYVLIEYIITKKTMMLKFKNTRELLTIVMTHKVDVVERIDDQDYIVIDIEVEIDEIYHLILDRNR
jgi:chemotaxis regulatin CheY-phosphate phosphatase CheZ